MIAPGIKKYSASTLTFGLKTIRENQYVSLTKNNGKMNPTRHFKQIKGYTGYYVSTDGIVLSYRKTGKGDILNDTPKYLKPLKIKTHCKEYYRVGLMVGDKHKWLLVHRLVALAFLENPKNKPQVNHKDNNGLNNNLDNLEWVNNSENQIHRFKLSGTYSNLGLYIYKNREHSYRVQKKGVIDKCFKTLEEAKIIAQKYY